MAPLRGPERTSPLWVQVPPPRSRAEFLPGELEEYVLQRAALDAKAIGEHSPLGAPGSHRGEQQGVHRTVYLDHIVAGRRFLDRAGWRQHREEVVGVQPGFRAEPELADRAGELARRVRRHQL